jgi:TonB family protein
MDLGEPSLGIEVTYHWGDQLLEVAHYDSPRPVIVAPEQIGGRKQIPLACRDEDGRLQVCWPRVQTLDPGEVASIDLGGVTAELCLKPTPPRAVTSWRDRFDSQFLNLLVAVAIVAAGFAITAVNGAKDIDLVGDEDSAVPLSIVKRISSTSPVRPTGEAATPLPHPVGSARRGREGRAGVRGAPERDAILSPRPIEIDPHVLTAVTGLLRQAFEPGDGVSEVLAGGGLAGDVREALGHLQGDMIGDAAGWRGLGERGEGPGGGGSGFTIGPPGFPTRAIGIGLPGFGSRVGAFPGKRSPQIDIGDGGSSTSESFPKDLIRSVIHAHRAEIRYCYEQELLRKPTLAGKISIRFEISPEGRVDSENIEQSTLNDSVVERCLSSRVRQWQFPRPKAGGVVVVTYPFLFRPAGE